MAKYNDDQMQILIEHNITQAKSVLRKAQTVNKGRYVHDINAGINKLTYWIPEVELSMKRDEGFLIMCKTKQKLAATLYMLEHGI